MRVSHKRSWRLPVIAASIFVLVAGGYVLLAPVRQSKQLEQTLIDQYGWANHYLPPIDGSIKPDRIEAFVRIREAMQPSCAVFQDILNKISTLESIEEDEEMPAGEKASKSISGFKSMISAAPKFLEFMDRRNTSLLAEEMGLGEYVYLYLSAYGEQLANEANSEYAEMSEAYVSQRIRDEYSRILGNLVTAAQANGSDASSEGLISDLQAEITALNNGSRSSPWPGGPPDRTHASLAPYQQQLAGLYCAGIVKIELMQKNRGLNFEG
jgi:hypothetical protein